MIAYKGFSKNLTATMGRGIYQYKIGMTVEEKKAKCGWTGFHCTEEPLGVLNWYYGEGDRYCVVKAEGDVHEDGKGRISCEKITIMKELDRKKLAIHECHYLAEHPNRTYSNLVKKEVGTSDSYFAIVRGKKPIAKGKAGTLLLLLKEAKESPEIEEIVALEVDGIKIKAGTYYGIAGTEVKNAEKRAKKN